MNRLKVCHVTSVHRPLDGRIFERECTSLAQRYDVFLIAPNIEDCEKNGVHVRGVNLPKSRFKRMKSLNRVLKRMIEVNADVYHFHDPELIPIGLKIKKRGKKIVFDSHENIPTQIRAKSYIPFRNIVSRIYEYYERISFRKYDALVSVTPEIVVRLKTINKNTYMLTNFPLCKAMPNSRTWQRKIGFAGLVQPQWKIHVILEAIKDLDVIFEVAGLMPDNYKRELETHQAWSKVNYHGVISHGEVYSMLQTCTIGMAVSTDSNPNIGMKKGSIGVTKLFEYMGLGIPVIASDLTSWKPIIEGNKCGCCVNCNDVDAIKKCISTLLDNLEKAKVWGDNGRKIAEKSYSWESQEAILFEMYDYLERL